MTEPLPVHTRDCADRVPWVGCTCVRVTGLKWEMIRGSVFEQFGVDLGGIPLLALLDVARRMVADAALAFDDAQRAYLTHLDRPNKPESPNLDDPAIAAEWFGPWERASEANHRFRQAVVALRAALEEPTPVLLRLQHAEPLYTEDDPDWAAMVSPISDDGGHESDEWLSLRDVAEMFGVHRNTIKRTPPAVLPYLRIGARGDRRYRRSDVEAMIERRMVR